MLEPEPFFGPAPTPTPVLILDCKTKICYLNFDSI